MEQSALCHWQTGQQTDYPAWNPQTVDGFPAGCSLHLVALQGGLSQGMRVLDINTGAMTIRVLPDKGMGIWKAWHQGEILGWESPVRNGPVHPGLVNQERRAGLGWLDGFDELLCRCGLASVGPPGKEEGQHPFTLHGRIANLPAWALDIQVNRNDGKIIVRGSVDECSLFDHQFRLTTTYTFTAGSSRIEITDRVENLSAKTDHFQMLYHLNVGRPILGPGAKVLAPVRELSPQAQRAAEGIDGWDLYGAPQQGFAEQVFLMHLHGDSKRETLALLQSSDSKKGVVVRFCLDTLPCFTVWKNTGAVEEGYVTGLEPATCFPNFRGFERTNGRIRPLNPGEAWQASWSVEWLRDQNLVHKAEAEIKKLAGQTQPVIHRTPHPAFTPQTLE